MVWPILDAKYTMSFEIDKSKTGLMTENIQITLWGTPTVDDIPYKMSICLIYRDHIDNNKNLREIEITTSGLALRRHLKVRL